MGKDNFAKNSFLLTASNITTGVLGFIFSIYLSKTLGSIGMGLYSLIMPIYNLFICLMTAGIIAAISQVSAVYTAKGELNNLAKTIKSVSFFNIIWSVIIGVSVFFLAPLISKYAINDIRTIDAIRVTCPAMIFIALSNILKGYFLGISKIVIPSFIDILEKAMRIITIGILFSVFNPKDLTSLVTLAYSSLAIGELQSLFFLYIYYKYVTRDIKKTSEKAERQSQLLFNVLIISLPLSINGFLSNIFGTISTLIVPHRLIAAGFESSVALGMIGKFSGMAFTIITFPMIVIGSINSLIIPDLSQSLSRGDYYNATLRIKKVLKIAFLLGLATTIICNIIPDSLGIMLFSRDDLGSYIRIGSLCAPIFFVASCTFGILNGLNKQGIILRNSLITAAIEVICLYIFIGIPSINILGYALTLFITSTLTLIMNLYEVKKHLDLNLSKYNIAIFLLLSIFIFIFLNIISNTILSNLFISKNIIIILGTFAIFAVLSFFGIEED